MTGKLRPPRDDTAAGAPPGAWRPLRRVVLRTAGFLDHFLHVEASSGVVLLISAALALALANSPWSESYASLWHTEVGVHFGPYSFARSLEWIVNDGLMVVFFFVVGLEIRREIHQGELSELRRAALPLIAALGGVAAPALLYVWLANDPAAHHGWAVPTATDIAFAVGVLALLGKRAPPALRVLLLALAVIDDLAAIVIIACFYSGGVQWFGFAIAAAGVASILVLRAAGIRAKAAYLLPGLLVWAGTYATGVHPTIAGVALGLMTPVHAWLGPAGFVSVAPAHLANLTHAVEERADAEAVARDLRPLRRATREALSPAESLIESLHPWVAFGIMPVFALANAGVSLQGLSFEGVARIVTTGAFVGLVVGKPLGIMLVSAAALRLKLVRLPTGLTLRHILVLGTVAGIGFTMAIFVAQLAFTDAQLLGAAKLGVLAASATAGLLSLAMGRSLLPTPSAETRAAASANEAERFLEK